MSEIYITEVFRTIKYSLNPKIFVFITQQLDMPKHTGTGMMFDHTGTGNQL
jgi:hypothetical protein